MGGVSKAREGPPLARLIVGERAYKLGFFLTLNITN